MARVHSLLLVLLASAVAAVATPAWATGENGTATLSLDELLRLHQSAQAKIEEVDAPPVAYAVSSFEVRARIIGDAIAATASVRLTVFEKGWVRVPILEPDPTLDITQLPAVANGHFASPGGALSFITNQAGNYEFEIGFLKRASKRGSGWEIIIEPAAATIQKLHLNHDAGLFEVTSADARSEGDALVIYARRGQLQLSWKALRPTVTLPKRDQKRPPIDPVVTSATASVVVTLDGQRITRSYYELRFQGAETLEVSVPAGQVITKVYLNGIARPIELTDGRAHIAVTPPRPGEQTGVVEVVLKEQTPPMALSGTLSFELPVVSWGVNEMRCTLFLPDVFNYSWVGGSLSPGDWTELPAYTFEIPTPGKTISVKQQLVNGSPDTVVEYTVDLTDNYFH